MTLSDALIILGVLVFLFAIGNMSLVIGSVAVVLVGAGMYVGRKEFS